MKLERLITQPPIPKEKKYVVEERKFYLGWDVTEKGQKYS